MHSIYLRTDFPNGRSHILFKLLDSPIPELNHFLLVLNRKGVLWVDVYWPYDSESERCSRVLSELDFWHTFREWRLAGLKLGSSETVAEFLAHKQLAAHHMLEEKN
ncbi:hypothetical protein REC12_01885 [Desulfosporosinus sp. PR]|uniref:hypothetical protein n=1 Tax=Candidatus Desulfosporosinus nitrosoreducens TaxID=3401928 RepID=UPI0027F00331|nr:hypothetical protein [Desulfosporosinus sp. PR]MDQ7092342.1 hypothetical protein [Desulfosporosinus sp. PR]